MKIITVVGARPQFIKASAISREIAKYFDIQEIIVHTGQHFDKNMSEIFFNEIHIPKPLYNLDVNMLNHGAMTGRMLEKIEKILIDDAPDLVLIYGDTNSTLAGALAASKLHIPVAHVESGLRSFNMKMPEEINRILSDRISDFLFCPTLTAVNNLKQEGFENFCNKIILSGDVMYDSVLFYSELAEQKSKIVTNLNLQNYILCTLHREENTNDLNNLASIIDALNITNKKIPVVLPLHPRTKKLLKQNNITMNFNNIEPVGYLDMMQLLKHCSLVVTDSGGLQKEAFFFKKNCVTLRNETEWIELVENGFNIIAGSDKNKICGCIEEMLNKKSDFSLSLYGNGDASKIIIKELKKYFS
jgi:UDP-GlcNAc3NAcA epimerase